VRTVRSAANGDFVVAWAGGRTTPDLPRAQRFASDGSAVGSEFVVASAPAVYAALAVHPAGEFIVVWDGADDGDTGGIGGQRFASDGTPIGTEFIANT